jgi:hypothetical protein
MTREQKRRKKHMECPFAQNAMIVGRRGAVHWPNNRLFKTRYRLPKGTVFALGEWATRMGTGAYRARISQCEASRDGRSFRDPGRDATYGYDPPQFMGYREGPIRENLALGALQITTTNYLAEFGGIDQALLILGPVADFLRRNERYLVLYARLVCLANENDEAGARKLLQDLIRAREEAQREQKCAPPDRRQIYSPTSVGLADLVGSEGAFRLWHANTVSRADRPNSFRKKLERRVRFAQKTISAAQQEMGVCSSNGKDTHLSDKGSTPLQDSLQYRFRSRWARFRRQIRRKIRRRLRPRDSREQKRSRSGAVVE